MERKRPRFGPAGRTLIATMFGALIGCGPLVATYGQPAPATATTLGAAAVCTNRQVVASWPLLRQARQTIVVPVAENHVADVGSEVAFGVGGVILFGNQAPANLGTQLRALTGLAPRVAPLVMTDEEGGAVQRMATLVGDMPSARTMAATMTPLQVQRLARRVGSRMRAAGVTMDLAPVLDLDAGNGPNATDPDGTRSFSLNPKTTTRYGLAFARGLLASGVTPVVKHFPGLGQASANTDVAPARTQPWGVLQQHGLLPFTAAVAAGMPALMTTNARVPGLTSVPASLSWKATHEVLRERLGFHGLVLTDSLSAVAISAAGFHVPRASVRALEVGADMVLFTVPAGQVADVTHRIVQAILAAVRAGDLSRARLQNAVLHVLQAKHVRLCS